MNPTLTLEVKGAHFVFNDGKSLKLPDIQEEFSRLLVVKGHIGSGKTVLLKALAGVYAPSEGIVQVTGYTPLKNCFVHSQAEFNFVTGTVGDELDFAGVARGPFENFADRNVNEVSGGELKRIAVMMALGADNDFILLDEPLDMLDDEQAEKIADYIITYANVKPIIVATHDNYFDSMADVIVSMDDVRADRLPVVLDDNIKEGLHFSVRDFSVQLGERHFPKISFDLHAGELICLYGRNGSGKTLFIREIAGIGGGKYSGTKEWFVEKARRGFCLQFPEQMIFHEKISEEIADIAGTENIETVLTALDWQGRGDASPFSLSDGEKRAMYIVSVLTGKDCCVFDEPFAGLDQASAAFIAHSFCAAGKAGKSIFYTANRRRDILYANTVIKIIK